MGGDNRDAVQRLSPVENATLGVVAGAIEVTILQPMLYCKNATQAKLPLTLDPRVLYRGLTVSVVNMGILTGLQFPLTGAVSKIIAGGEARALSDVEQLGAAFTGGAISGLVCGPMELVMIQQQRFGTTLFATPAKIVADYGLMGLTRGLVTSCGREGIFTAGYMALGQVIGRRLQKEYGLGPNQSKLGGAICAGVIAASVSHPLDTIKTCMQGDLPRTNYGTLAQTARTLHADGGVKRFFSGWSWRTGRMILAVLILNEVKNQLAPVMFPHHFA